MSGKGSASNSGDIRDMGLFPGSGRSPGEGNGNPLRYSCLENPMDRRAWWATVHGITEESDMTEATSDAHMWGRVMWHVYMCVQLCLTLCDPMDCSPPGSSVSGIFQARILEWVATSFSRESSLPRDQTCVSYIFCFGRQILYRWCYLGSPVWSKRA